MFLQEYLSQIKELSDTVHFHFLFSGETSLNFHYSSVIHRQQIDIKIKESIFSNSADNTCLITEPYHGIVFMLEDQMIVLTKASQGRFYHLVYFRVVKPY